jgi:opacity protein-like surface antigen
VEARQLFPSGEMGRDVRRAQGSVRVPLWEGEGRLGVQLRRIALQSEGTVGSFGEVRFDGFTAQADWGGSDFFPLAATVRWERERRRGVLAADRTMDGVEGSARTGGRFGMARWGAEVGAGWREPYGFTWGGTGTVDLVGTGWRLGGSVSHDEDLPSMVLSVDRPTPESGIGGHLAGYEAAAEPEQRSAVRVEGEWTRGPLNVLVAGWGARQRHYRIDSNPVWTEFSGFAPLFPIPGRADVYGVAGRVRLDLFGGLYGAGGGRIHDRALFEIPYVSRWIADGALHWRRRWFRESLDLDASVGGVIVGPRENPDGERYVTTALGHLTLEGTVGNGRITVSFRNLADSYLESDIRSPDTVTPFPVPGRILLVGLTMYLSQ